MKTPYLYVARLVTVIGLSLAINGLFAACDKLPFLKDGQDKSSSGQGIVQTDWKGVQEIRIEAESKPEDTEMPAPPQRKVEAKEKDPAKPAASPSTPPAVAIEKAPSEDAYSVQIGAFLVPDNATRLMSKMKAKGYKPSVRTVKTPAKQWRLVRIGSFPDKKAAVEAAKKFTAKEKMETAVVKDRKIVDIQRSQTLSSDQPQASPESTMPETVAKFEPERFAFQVGGLRTEQNANIYLQKLKKQGYAPYLKKMTGKHSNEIWYAVRIGTFDSIGEAAEAAETFTMKEQIPARAVSVN